MVFLTLLEIMMMSIELINYQAEAIYDVRN